MLNNTNTMTIKIIKDEVPFLFKLNSNDMYKEVCSAFQNVGPYGIFIESGGQYISIGAEVLNNSIVSITKD